MSPDDFLKIAQNFYAWACMISFFLGVVVGVPLWLSVHRGR